MNRIPLLVIWLVLAAAPLAWWLVNRRKVDVWRALPVPAAILDRSGAPIAVTGPSRPFSPPATDLPARGRITQTRAADGTPLALTGLRDGALAVALQTDPLRQRRDRLLADLGARLAHDINTPLGVLYGHLDLIAHEAISEPARESVRTCQREVKRLQTTAQDLLTLTRLRAGGSPRAEHFAGALAEEAVAGLLDEADALGASLTVELPADNATVMVSDAELVRALRNLVANSLHYGLGTTRAVRVLIDANDDTVTFTVADSGPGLSAEQLAQLSEPLTRGPDPTHPGSGLGLAIVNEVLAGHGSNLLTDPAPDGGRLSFTLPRAR